MVLAPHWLDSVIGDLRDPQQIAQAIAFSPQFIHIVKAAVDRANVAEDRREEQERKGTHIYGPGTGQMIRSAIIAGVTDSQGDVATD